MLGIKNIRISPRNSSANGRVERVHKIVGDSVRAYLAEDPSKSWSEILPILEMGLRSAVSAHRPLSPYYIRLGQNVRVQCVAEPVEGPVCAKTTDEYVKMMRDRWDLIRKVHYENLQADQTELVSRYNRLRANPFKPGYSVGMKVWLKNEQGGNCRKTRPEYVGPYKIIHLQGDRTVKLQHIATGRILLRGRHINHLKPYYDRDDNREETKVTDRKEEDKTTENKDGKVKENSEVDKKNKSTGSDSDDSSDDDDEDTNNNNESDQKAEFDNEYHSIDKILGVRKRGSRTQYLLKWTPVDGKVFQPTWQDSEDLDIQTRENYHTKYTMDGKVRKKYKKNRKQQ